MMTDEERIEKVLNEMANISNGRLNVQQFLADTAKDEDPLAYQRIVLILESKGFARKLSTIPSLELLPDGRDIVKSGGYIKHLEKIKSEKEEDARLKKIKADLDESNLRLTGFYYKWRWVPFVLSIAAIILSLIALFWKL
jgi:hypothetical protein